jgi:hypothetical protein
MRAYRKFKSQAIVLRRSGKTYTEIQEILKSPIPPSTLSDWFKDAEFSPEEDERILLHGKERIRQGSKKAVLIKKVKNIAYFKSIQEQFIYLKEFLNDKDIAKISLAVLYLAEGSKHRGGSLCLGNSDPHIIRLYLRLLRNCYEIDERKFRCTVQHRADQNAKVLKLFWSEITLIPLSQFYGYNPDKRTIGIPTKKVDYKGVCRIDYLSTAVYNEVRTIGGLL